MMIGTGYVRHFTARKNGQADLKACSPEDLDSAKQANQVVARVKTDIGRLSALDGMPEFDTNPQPGVVSTGIDSPMRLVHWDKVKDDSRTAVGYLQGEIRGLGKAGKVDEMKAIKDTKVFAADNKGTLLERPMLEQSSFSRKGDLDTYTLDSETVGGRSDSIVSTTVIHDRRTGVLTIMEEPARYA